MPDMEAIAARLAADLGSRVLGEFKRLESELTARIDATTVKGAFIDREGALVLTHGDGSTRVLGPVVGPPGAKGEDAAPADLGALERRLEAVEGRTVTNALIDQSGCLILALGGGGVLSAGKVAGSPGEDAAPADLGPLERRIGELEGRAITSALIDQSGSLVLALGGGGTISAGKVVGRDGTDGKDGAAGAAGAPGLGFDDLGCSLAADGRTLIIRFSRGEQESTFELAMPAMVYRGVYEVGRTYLPGDTTTFGGSAWVCGAVTSDRPGEGDAWTLAVKRGRDGKDFAGPQIKAHA